MDQLQVYQVPGYPTSKIFKLSTNNLLDSLPARGHFMGSPGGPTHYQEPGRAHPKKNKKIFLVVVAHFLHVQIQPTFYGKQINN